MSRIERLGAAIESPLLVTYGVNVRYLTGFDSSNCALLVEPGAGTTLYTDFRYLEAAQAVGGVEVVRTPRDVVGALSELLAGRRVGFEAARLTYAQWETIGAGGADLVPTRGVVEALRAVKDGSEVDAIRRACAVSDAVYAALVEEPLVGRTEADVARWIGRAFLDHGTEGLSFDPIVASGINGSRPHAGATGTVIPEGDARHGRHGLPPRRLLLRLHADVRDGELPAQLAEAYALVSEAQLAGLAAVRPGRLGRDVDADSRVGIEAAGLGESYGHGLGHGLGLEVHELPNLRPESGDTLEPGNVVSVEPGLYLPAVGGVRIEDLVVVTDDGCEILTHFTKELVTLG